MRTSPFAALIILGLLGAYAQATTGVQGSLVRALDAKPGQILQIEISLSNTASTDETIKLSLEDMRVTPGSTTYLAPGQQERSNANWIKLPAATLTVPANGTRSFNVAITVPQDAAPGTHWSALIVEPDRLPTAGKGGVIINTRYAVNLVTTLPGGAAKISFAKPQLSRNGAEVNLGVDLLNAGAASSVPELRTEVYDAQGKLVAQAEAGKKRLYPGGGAHVDFKLGALPAAKYTFLVLANDGVSPVVGARYTVNVER